MLNNESLDQQLYTWNSPLFPPLPHICSHFGSIQGHSDSMYIYILNASQKYQCDSLELHMTEFFPATGSINSATALKIVADESVITCHVVWAGEIGLWQAI